MFKSNVLCAQNIIIFLGPLGPTLNIIGRDLYDHLMSKRVYNLIMNKVSSEVMRKVAKASIWIC